MGRVQTSVYRPREIHFFVLQFSRLDKDNHFNKKIGSRFNLKNPVLPVLLGTNKWLVDLDLECVQWRSEDWKDIIKVWTGHQAVPRRRRKMARSKLEERETVQAPGRKSRRRSEQGWSGVGQKADRNQPADTDQRSPVHHREQSQERYTNVEHDDSGPRNYDIEKSLEVLIQKQEESMKHMQRLEEKINQAKTKDQGSSKAKQTPAEFQYKRNKIQYELNLEVIDKIKEAMEADEPEERNRVLREGKGLLEHWNKCLLMAEKYGWDIVEHYEAEPLAENSDDEKKICKAIKEGKAKKEQRKTVTKVRKDSSKPYTNLDKPYFRAIPQAHASFQQNNGVQGQANTYSSVSEKVCYRCGKPGHFIRSCKAPIPF